MGRGVLSHGLNTDTEGQDGGGIHTKHTKQEKKGVREENGLKGRLGGRRMRLKAMREVAATEAGEGPNPSGLTGMGAGRLWLAGGVRGQKSGRRRCVSNWGGDSRTDETDSFAGPFC